MAKDEGLAALSHLLALFFGIFGPLVIYLVADDDSFAKENAANALNFQILILIAGVVAGVLSIVLIGLLLIPLIGLAHLAFTAIAAYKAYNGEAWKYPLTPDIV